MADENHEKVFSGYRFIGRKSRCIIFLNTFGHTYQGLHFQRIQGVKTEHVIWPSYAVQLEIGCPTGTNIHRIHLSDSRLDGFLKMAALVFILCFI